MKVILVFLVICKLCWTIRVPVSWDETESDVANKQEIKNEEEFSVESFKPQDVSEEAFKPQGESFRPGNEKPVPVEYFEYTAKKPQFAVDVAAFHGVQSPENHYKAYPIKPFTGRVKPELGRHHILDSGNTLHKPFQDYTKINEEIGHATPVSSSYEVFHPYESETPALQEIYKDPILTKIRNDLENSKNRLQQYEKDAGEPDITSDEHLESPQKTDGKLFPQRHQPAPFEIHRPLRRPIYYRPTPVYKSREQYLNHKLRHPWNHNIAKVRPMHYRPIQNHIHHLRQNHALKYDDERNEYPQVQILENYSDPKDGYDIYEKGRDKFVQQRNNVDESINRAVKENRPTTYKKLEVLNNDSTSGDDDDDEEEFVPIKNYAQVRKTETYRHLPKSAALEDAETYDEIKNAPRLREAVKSTKAQTVYSEEGYEDAAYDHAGEQKHASENEGHGGFLKENEISGGKYKTPSISANYEDGKGSVYRDQLIHAEKWKNENEDTKEEKDEEDYSEDEHEYLLEADNHQTEPQVENNRRDKRENNKTNETLYNNPDSQSDKPKDSKVEHEVDIRKANFEIPQVDFNSTFFTDKEFLKIAKLKVVPKKDTIKQKYPYYYKKLKAISRNSPLRYAENFKLIPTKSKGGTEFYDSRSNYECPDVDDVPDPIPEKLKGEGHPDKGNESNEDESSTKGDENFDTTKKQPRLKGLGDKIDCFKSKYFGENPLDSPFFKEDIISNPEPVFLPNIAAFKLKNPILIKQKIEHTAESNPQKVLQKLQTNSTSSLYDLIEKLRNDTLQNPLKHKELILSPDKASSHNYDNSSKLEDQSSVYTDVIKNIRNSFKPQHNSYNVPESLNVSNKSEPDKNITYVYFRNKEDVTQSLKRKKRAVPFVYEPYKIIKDIHVQDDIKKTTILSNMSPLIKQLQTSRLIEKGNKLSPEEVQLVKRHVHNGKYKDITQKDREIRYGLSKNEKSIENPEIVDVNVDKRRGEPRYEIKHVNHKSRYTPVSNLKTMAKEDYEKQLNDNVTTKKYRGKNSSSRLDRQNRPTENSYFDISEYIPHTTEVHNVAASNTVRKTVSTTTPVSPVSLKHEQRSREQEDSGSEEDYAEYDEEEEEVEEITTTSTTAKPAFRRKIRPQTTTQDPLRFIEEPRLKLVTRFRDYKPKDHSEKEKNVRQQTEKHTEKPTNKYTVSHGEGTAPNFREKKKKITKSTLVTDTKKYGDVIDNDDEMMKDVVDALIGVKHDMDDYVPLYEKDQENKPKRVESNGADEDIDPERINDDEDIDEDDYDDEDEDEDDDEDDDEEDEDDEDEDDSKSATEKENDNSEHELEPTTPEPTKRTLVITTDAPLPTSATRNAKIQEKPIVTRKKIEIHKELPVNKSSPHITQFKQDIKEIEIIKESRNPLKRKPNKNVEVLDLYKDDNLAKDINKLGVEVFKENLDLRQGPKHGGNYRTAEPKHMILTREKPKYSKDDAETSQSEFTKNIKLDTSTSVNPTYLRAQQIKNRASSSKLIELNETPDTALHGGNLRHRGRSRNNSPKSEKIIELDDEHDEDSSNDSKEELTYKARNKRPLHGGNYRSAKLTEENKPETSSSIKTKDARRNAALVLNSFVQAAPVLTTTPIYILDPSKRKYYYLDS